MENIKIAVVSDNREYGRALGMGMLNVCKSLVIKLYSKDSFFEQMHSFHEKNLSGAFSSEFDIILWDGEEVRGSYGGNFVYMAEKPSMLIRDTANRKFSIYKYSCAQSFVSEIFEIYSAITGLVPVNTERKTVEFITFGAWKGGTGCSTVAMLVSRELSRFYGKKVLYVSLEEIESTAAFITAYSGAKSMGQYLYHLFRERKRRPFIESYIIKDEFGVEAFAPTRGRNPLREMDRDELLVFLESLTDSGRYDTIVIDVGSNLSSIDIACMELAGHICITTIPETERDRQDAYMQYMICRCGEDVVNRIVKVENFCDGSLDNRQDPFIKKIIGLSKETCFTGADGVSKIIGDGETGKEIANITRHLTEPFS